MVPAPNLRVALCALAMVWSVAAPPAVFSQATTGEITGRVADQAGAVVPGATVTAENEETAFSRTTTTNDAGEYILTLLPPGRYTVTAEASGFRKVLRKEVPVNVGTRQTLGFELLVGTVTEEVVVSGATPLVETTRSELGGIVTPTEITNLPLLNRTFANLSMIDAGSASSRKLRSDEDPRRQLRDERRRRPAARRQRRRWRQQGQCRRQSAAELRVRVDPGVPGPAAPLERGERPRGRRGRERHLEVGHECAEGLGIRHVSEIRISRQRTSSRSAARKSRASSGGSTAVRLADRSCGTTCSSSARWSGSTNRRGNADQVGCDFASWRRFPGASAVRAIPTPYDDTAADGKVDHRLIDRPDRCSTASRCRRTRRRTIRSPIPR